MSRILRDQKYPALRCDGCGILAGEEHLRRRTRRLEMATRFRPVHIGALLLFPAPPVRMEEFPYFTGDDSSRRGRSAFHDTLLAAAGIPVPEAAEAEDSLARLQRVGIFMAWVVECPLDELGREITPASLAKEYGAELVLRIMRSYKARFILPIGALLEVLPPALQSAELSSQPLLDAGMPFDMPEAPEGRAFRALQAALSQTVAAGVAHQ
jgi:hypothetical protein